MSPVHMHVKWDRDMLMAQFVLCVHVVIWKVLRVPAIDSHSKPRYMYGI